MRDGFEEDRVEAWGIQVVDDDIPAAHLVERRVRDVLSVNGVPVLHLLDERIADLVPVRDIVEAVIADVDAVFVDEEPRFGGHDVGLEDLCGGVDFFPRPEVKLDCTDVVVGSGRTREGAQCLYLYRAPRSDRCRACNQCTNRSQSRDAYHTVELGSLWFGLWPPRST